MLLRAVAWVAALLLLAVGGLQLDDDDDRPRDRPRDRPPLYYDPRNQPACASVFGPAEAWRAAAGHANASSSSLSGGLDVQTREDARYGRTAPHPRSQLAPLRVCFDHPQHANHTVEVALRMVPKAGSQTLSDRLKKWPGAAHRCRRRMRGVGGGGPGVDSGLARPAPPVLAFAFVRHPFSRLVSGFHTVLSSMASGHATPKAQPALFRQPFWLAYRALAGTDASVGSGGGLQNLLQLTPQQVVKLFGLFVRDALVAPPFSAESGRNGLDPIMHHVHSQVVDIALGGGGHFLSFVQFNVSRLSYSSTNFDFFQELHPPTCVLMWSYGVV